jgi:hypothetical protein
MSLALGFIALSAGKQATYDLAGGGPVEPMKVWIMGGAAGILLALWMPWRAVRILGALLSLLVPAGMGLLGVIALCGGPDARGPAPAISFFVLLAVVLASCLPMLAFVYCEWRMARQEGNGEV